MSFGHILQQRRKATGLSLRTLARKVGVDPAYLSRVEKGTVPPSEQLLRELAGLVDLSQDELFLLAGRLPDSLRHFVSLEPRKVTAALTSLAEMVIAQPEAPYGGPFVGRPGLRSIEDGFPFAELSEVAEVESWRKEIYRPIYHLHKWWAQRLGSVFRALILGATMPQGSAVMELFYQPVRLPAPVVFDPFMGSGTTVGEAHKLGCTVIGRDINPVAWRGVRVALSPLARFRVLQLYEELEASVGQEILELYRSFDGRRKPCTVLYYFWVKTLPCPQCSSRVDLFSTRIFAKHAYVKRHPAVQVSCPGCDGIFSANYYDHTVCCPHCDLDFDPHKGAVNRGDARCSSCGESFPIARTARAKGKPPAHRLYAKLVLSQEGSREYLKATRSDHDAYRRAAARLGEMAPLLPSVPIRDGHNTRQVLNYGYTSWDQMFNARQLLAISLLAHGIDKLESCHERDALKLLFSGVLEFNNMFASYKGEGTGAVRHMFSHHVLKPERNPIEANVWGTPKSSGSFSTLFRSRLLRALDYQAAPFEVAVERRKGKKKGTKVFGVSPPMGAYLLDRYPQEGLPAGSVYLSCGDSSATDLPDQSVDLVITDPPFFDNVHYSELADFFHVWQRIYFKDKGKKLGETTRQESEVQDANPQEFAKKLRAVFRECHRVLWDDGLLIFSYHHSREEGWTSVAEAVLGAGFVFVQGQPVKAEMSGATPKSQARTPIDLDILLICRKRRRSPGGEPARNAILERASKVAAGQVGQFNRAGRSLSENDVRVVLSSQLLVALCREADEERTLELFPELLMESRDLATGIWQKQEVAEPSENGQPPAGEP